MQAATRARQEVICRSWYRLAKRRFMEGLASAQQSVKELLFWLKHGDLSHFRPQDVATILQVCRRHRDRASVTRLYVCLQSIGLETHAYLGNYLVPTLVDVGCIQIAQQVFDRLMHANEWSWNLLISGYVNRGELHHAFRLYNRLPKDRSIQILACTYVALLKASAKQKNLEYGLEIHADVAKRGLITNDLFVGSALVDFYAKCGFLTKAQEVFDSLPIKDAVCWTVLLAGYAEHGHSREALFYFRQMQRKNINPDAVTFVCALKACAIMQAESDGEEIHVELERLGLLQRNIIVGNALVDMYSKCGALGRAEEVFDKLAERNVVSWTAFIAGRAEYGRDQEAVIYYEQMLRDGVLPNSVTYMSVLKGCGSSGSLQTGCQIHCIISFYKSLLQDMIVANALLGMYAKSGAITSALGLFEKLEARDVHSWAILILGYTEEGRAQEALELLERMQVESAFPDTVSYTCGLKCCSMLRAGDKGRDIHAELERRGLLEVDALIGNSLVDMYGKCGLLALAKEVFNLLPVQDVVSWTSLISGYADHGYFEEALKCFEQMQLMDVSPNIVTYVCVLNACSSAKATEKAQQIHIEIAKYGSFDEDIAICNILVDVYAKGGLLVTAHQMFDKLPTKTEVSWSTLILGYSEHRCAEEVINLFKQMQLEGVFADSATLVCVLKACCDVGALHTGQEIHAEIERKGVLESELVGNTLITMYANSGLLSQAQQVFDRLPFRDVVSWTALMGGYGQVADIVTVLCFYERMLREGFIPDSVTFCVILNACGCCGLNSLSETFFEAMTKDYGLGPAIDHHICLVKFLFCIGKSVEAEAIIRQLPDDSSDMIWNAFLSYCKCHRDVEFLKPGIQVGCFSR